MIINRPITVVHGKSDKPYNVLHLEVYDCTDPLSLVKMVLYCRDGDVSLLFVREAEEFWSKFSFSAYGDAALSIEPLAWQSRSLLSQDVIDCTNVFADRRMVMFANIALPGRLYVCEYEEFWRRYPFTTKEVV